MFLLDSSLNYKMIENKRIFINIIATYGRSIFILACGLITARWSLEALGEVDFGLLGLIGGLISLVKFFNGSLARAVGRFYAFSIGQTHNDATGGLECCQEWFNSALLLHFVISILLISIGYPIGVYAVKHWLTIPVNRIDDCVLVWFFSCISCFSGMVTVPFIAMYTAKQYIAELTIYSIVTTSINVFFLYYIVTHEGNWLVACSIFSCLLAITPLIIISIRACYIFPECKFNKNYLWSLRRIKKLFIYAGWQLFGSFSIIARSQGIAILLNKYFGPSVNAAMNIGNNISGKTTTFSGGMIGAFQPAIVKACGTKDFKRMRKLAFMTCKFGTLLMLIFALPVALELPQILKIWLINPPKYTAELCWCLIIMLVIEQTAVGHILAVNASGKIAMYQTFLGTSIILTFPLAWILIACGFGVYSVGYAMIITMMISVCGRVWFARIPVKMSARYWLNHVLLPLCVLVLISSSIGLIPQLFLEASLERIFITCLITEITFCIVSWFFVFNTEERNIVLRIIDQLKDKFKIKTNAY